MTEPPPPAGAQKDAGGKAPWRDRAKEKAGDRPHGKGDKPKSHRKGPRPHGRVADINRHTKARVQICR